MNQSKKSRNKRRHRTVESCLCKVESRAHIYTSIANASSKILVKIHRFAKIEEAFSKVEIYEDDV